MDVKEGPKVRPPTHIPRPRIAVLFVCTGNICRSPTAEGVFRQMVEAEGLADRIAIDSAGTHAFHVGEPPDPRSQLAARQRGYDLSQQQARQISDEDFERFNYIITMDKDNYRIVRSLCPEPSCHKVRRLLSFAADETAPDVPDPYYGGDGGFERVLDLIETACRGLLDEIREHDMTVRQ